MLSIEITRLIFAAVAAVLLGYACYVAAYVKHKNEKRDTANRLALMAKSSKTSPEAVYDPSCMTKVDLEKTETWYFGYRLALLGLIVVATAIGWAVSWFVGQDYVLTWVEDGALAAAGAIIGGFIADKYIIHSIADGVFFERVEDPLVQRFLQDAVPVVEEVAEKKPGFFARRKAKKEKKVAKEAAEAPAVSAAPEEHPQLQIAEDGSVIAVEHMSFDEKVKLIEKLRKSL